MRILASCCLTFLLAPVTVTAQESQELSTPHYDENTSWGLFAACDRNSDDRLDVFEASNGMVEIDGPRDATGFRRVDQNRDGFVQWPEFDVRFRETIRIAEPFRIVPCRPVVRPEDPTLQSQTPSIAERVFDAFNADGDGGIDAEELRDLLRLAQLDPALASHFSSVDTDRSGRIDATELAPIVRMMTAPDELLKPNRELRAALPLRFQSADRNLDGVISTDELEIGLRRMDPLLGQWTNQVLTDADLNGNGSLGAAEILRAVRRRNVRRPARPNLPTGR